MRHGGYPQYPQNILRQRLLLKSLRTLCDTDSLLAFCYALAMILVISSKDSYAAKRLLEEAKLAETGLKIVGADELRGINVDDFNSLYIRDVYVNQKPRFLAEVISLAKNFRALQKKVVDANVANGHIGQGKWVMYQKLVKAGLPIPKTQPLTSKNLQLTYPVIVKWIYGFKAQHTYLVDNVTKLKNLQKKYPKKELLVQKFIQADCEYKFITIGYKSLPVALKFKTNDSKFKINFSSGQKVAIGQLPSKLVKLAERASRVLGRQLAKVDILEYRGQFYILEANRFPGLESFEKITKYNVTKEFLKYLSR